MQAQFTSVPQMSSSKIKAEEVHHEQEKIYHMEDENIIHTTRKIIKNMTEQQRFIKAKAHVMDSLNYQHPRFQSQSLTTPIQFKICYGLISSQPWHWLLYIFSYVFMYMVIFDSQEHYTAKIAVQTTILVFFWIDVVLRKYVKTFDKFGKRLQTNFFNIRTILIILMTIDLILFAAMPGFDSRPIRPFRILRCFVPLLYDTAMRRTFFSLASAYTDILVYLVFFAIVVCGFALIGNRSLTFDVNFRDSNPLYTLPVDPYKSNYSNLGTMIFITYVVATYDSYPDNQLIAVQNYEPNYIFFIVFIFLNMFLFSSIPGSLVYNKFRQTHSKLILMDEIRQQHSLIIAFVTLAQDSNNLDFNILIKFLNYLYRYKIRYVEYITDICLKIDDNHNKTIQVNEFMQLSQIILENRAMLPPRFDDIETWVKFRTFCKQTLHLKAIVSHWLFEAIVSFLIILSFINSLFFSFNYSDIVNTFDSIFIWLFLVQLTIRIVAIGPQNFFADRWNNLDTFLVLLGVFFFFLPISNNAGSIARIGRIFRVASLLRIASHSNFLRKGQIKLIFFQKLKMIFQVLLEIMPIILRFLPLFLFTFYVFSIIAMQLFYNSYDTNGSPDYNQYDQFSSFRTFIQAHYIMVQMLTEAGWSMIAYDLCWRNPQYYGYIMCYFCFMHIIIVYIIATLIKGIFWEVYFTVDQIFKQRERQTLEQEEKQQQNEQRAQQIKNINEMIRQEQFINPDTILKRELYENNLDEKIFKRLKKDQERHQLLKKIGSKHGMVNKVYGLVTDHSIPIDQMQVSGKLSSRLKKINTLQQSYGHDIIDHESSRSNKIQLDEIQQFSEEDFESQIDDLFHQIILDPKVKYSHIVGTSKTFNQFLNSKFVRPSSLIKDNEFDLNFHPLYNDQSIQTHIYEMHTLLNIQTSKREQKAAIIRDLFDSDIIDSDTVQKLIHRKLFEKVFNVDTYGTLRRLFLSQTNQQLIKNFQVEYFSHLYGHSFKQINKMTLGPLLKVQSTLTYSLRNILRYPQIDNTDFFEMITHIEDQFSNQVLKRGSLFKFIYKLDGDNIWFSVQFKRQQEMRVHFIKTGVWCYSKDMEDNQVYYSRDAFKWDVKGKEDQKTCERFMKRLYESFEGLAFSLLDEDKFFESNPRKYIYDLYVQCFDAEKIRRFQNRQHEISKVMVVILSKQQRRQELGEPDLPYELTDMIIKEEDNSSQFKFNFDDSQNDIYQKLKNLTATDHEKIVNSEGLPFSYTVNLMQQLQDTFRAYAQNFIYHIEKVYNDQFILMTKKPHRSSDDHHSHSHHSEGSPKIKKKIGPQDVSIKMIE